MDPVLLAAIIFATAALAALAAVLIFRRCDNPQVAALGERVAQLADLHATAQTQMAQQMQAQERALTKSLDERLAHTTNRVNETLEKNSHNQKTSLDELKERLVRIDAAQQNITELSSQMVGLQDILSNKQARGAFGEVQLHDLVSSVLPPGGSERPSSQPIGTWQRRQKSPTPGMSLLATSSAAQKSGSRLACAIIEPAQLKPGSTASL